jgi:uncharacterized protein YbjT (DUF2867 family)
MIEVGGPEAVPMYELVRRYLAATDDSRKVVSDAQARYFGAVIDDRSLTPDDGARIGPTSFEQWLSRQPVKVG